MSTAIKPSRADWVKAYEDMPEHYQRAVTMHAEGLTWKEITAETGVGYASGWLAVRRCALRPEQIIKVDPAKRAELLEAIRHARLVDQDSWGQIMVRTGLAEGTVSKLFEEATSVERVGLRNGHGGRFYQDNAEAYVATPKIGWVRPIGEDTEVPIELTDPRARMRALLESQTAKQLAAFAKGKLPKPVPTRKAELVEALLALKG